MCAAAVTSLLVRMGDSSSALESLYIPAVPGTEVDLKALPPGDTVFEMFASRSDFALGEQIFLTVAGSMASGELFSYTLAKPVVTVGRPISFPVPAAVMNYMANSKGDAFYRKGSATGALSQNYAFTVKGDRVVLPIPQVTDTNNGALNPKELKADPNVVVAPWPDIKVGQHYWLTVEAVASDGKVTAFKSWDTLVDAAKVAAGLSYPLALKDLQALPEGTVLQISLRVTLGGGDDPVHALNYPAVTVKLGSRLDDVTTFKDSNMNGWEIPGRDSPGTTSAGRYGTIINNGGTWAFNNETPNVGSGVGQTHEGYPLLKYFQFVVGKEYLATCEVRSISKGATQPWLDIRTDSKSGAALVVPSDGAWHVLNVQFVANRVNGFVAIASSNGNWDGNDYQITNIRVKEL